MNRLEIHKKLKKANDLHKEYNQIFALKKAIDKDNHINKFDNTYYQNICKWLERMEKEFDEILK